MLLEKGARPVKSHPSLPDLVSLVKIGKQGGISRDAGEILPKTAHGKRKSVIMQAVAAIHPGGPCCDIGDLHWLKTGLILTRPFRWASYQNSKQGRCRNP